MEYSANGINLYWAGLSGQHLGLQKELVAEKVQAEHVCAGGWWEQCLPSHTYQSYLRRVEPACHCFSSYPNLSALRRRA